VNNGQVKNFQLASNHANFDSFDDIVVIVDYKNKTKRQIAYQLKYSQRNKLITENMLAASKGDFSIQKYKESYKKIKADNKLELNFHCILFTSAKFNATGGSKFYLENKKHIKITTSELKSKNTSNNVYKFDVENECGNQDDEIEEYKEFFDHFFLFANQKNVDAMKQDLSKSFQNTYHCDEAHFEDYVNKYIKHWSEIEGRKNSLDKKQIQFKIGEILLRPVLINSSILKDPLLQPFKEACVLFDVVIVNTNQDNIKNMFFKDNTIDSEQEDIWFAEITRDNEQMVYEGIRTIHKSGTKKTFVLVGDNIRREDFSNFKIFENLFDLRLDIHIYESIIQKNKISLQGRESIACKTIIANDEEMEKLFTTSELLQILSGKFRIGEEKEKLPEPYINQVLIKFVIDISFLMNTLNLSVISCENNLATFKKLVPAINLVTIGDYLQERDQENELISQINYHRRVIVAEDKCTAKDFDIFCKKNLGRNCHHFRLTNGNLEWIASRGNVGELRNYATPPKLVKESEIFNSWNRINVISAEAGMGKSVMLKFMKNRYPSRSWVLDVSLRSHFSFFEETQDPQEICRRIFQHHCSANRYNRFEERVGKQFLNKKQVAILLDGLDEIVDFKVICKVIAAVRALSECGFVVWISARRNLETVLINELCLFPLIIKQIDREQQISYAMERLKYGSDETKIIVEKLINLLNTTKSSAILGVLLQMKILTDLLYYNSKKYSQFIDNNFTLTDMIYYFIKETINFYLKDKGNTGSLNSFFKNIIKEYRQNKIEKYEIFSIKYFLEVEDFKNLPQAKFLNNSDTFEDHLGIITYVEDTRLSYFSHNIFGEYFAASWFVKNFKDIPNLAKFFFKQRYTNIRRMFDMMLSKNYPAHLAVLHNNLDDLSKYEKELEVRDDHGRSPLHLACSYGQAHPSLLVTKSEDKYIIDFEKGNFVQEESSVFANIFNFLIERCDPSERDRLFNWDCLHYAINAQSLFCVNSILERLSASHELFQNIYDDATLVFYSIKFNYIKLFEFTENLPYFESKDESNLLHQICLWKNRSKFLVTVLRNRQYLSVINKKRCVKQPFYIGNTTLPSCGLELEIFSVRNKVIHCLVVKETPLHIASILGNFDAVKILIENGADVNVLNNNGSNPLHYAASRGRLDIARLLFKSGAALNVSDVTKRNELHFAVVGIINRELITFLLDEGSFISFDSKKLSPLVIAVARNRLDIVQLLTRIKNFESWTSFKDCMYRGYFCACACNNPQQINYFLYIGVPIIIEDSYQSSILHFLPLFNAVESFKLLLQKGANANRKNNGGCSPLHVAAFSGNLNILKLLLDSGADINAQNNLGGTPLYCATFYKRFAAADFLKQNGADSTIADKYGITPDVILELYKYEHDLITRSITLENAKGLYSVIA
jgi:ankyrin repeat protein/2-C-methyl-D-erythritol 4-phosphate cytidylyltransferase